ncbi:protein PIN-LIKES 7-like isoform X1 [Zingiber officinale]|uniref:Auxin efflux carrier family protein n=1 Tax=Zingiber officinale TaxID=94328 RepID=A0A8J5GDP3_ZINOF|nr:protein PIN-LIKES 7-like isoform X1 [Zingiber officinale]KAG6501517.1 hypothetical protein ZIOFF_041398 [Zingiber officinale]
MEFLSLFLLAFMPVLQVLLVGLVGAFLASGCLNILSSSARNDINKIAFVVFVPSLVFASLAKTVTARDLVSWWFMPINVGLTFLIGGVLGWVAVKILKPQRHLEALVIACCSAGNLGTMPLIIIPAICDQDGNPFGDSEVCHVRGIAYVSFSMALGNLFIWTHTYNLIKSSSKSENNQEREALLLLPSSSTDSIRSKWKETAYALIKELLAPPTTASILGFIVGSVPWLKALFVGDKAPAKVVQDSVTLLGEGAVPCTIIILGSNLTQGLRKCAVKPAVIAAIICVRYVMLPLFGIAVVKAAEHQGFLPQSPLYQYVLLIQFTLPPAMSIGTMAQLFDQCKEECSVIFLWTYLAAALSMTVWSMVFMSMVS